MRYAVKATVNYPETEADTPDHECDDKFAVFKWLDLLLKEPDATSFVITVCKRAD